MSLPDGPKSPEIWQKLRWIGAPFSFMRSCSHRYGDSFKVRLSQKLSPVVFFSNPEALQLILTSDDSELFDAPGELNAILEPLLGTESVIGLSGERHRRVRQLLMPSFHGERMRAYGQLIQDITEEVMKEQVVGKAFSVRKAMQKISMRVILRAIFSLNEGPRSLDPNALFRLSYLNAVCCETLRICPVAMLTPRYRFAKTSAHPKSTIRRSMNV